MDVMDSGEIVADINAELSCLSQVGVLRAGRIAAAAKSHSCSLPRVHLADAQEGSEHATLEKFSAAEVDEV